MVGVGEATARLHQTQRAADELALQQGHVVAQQRGQIRIDHSRVAATNHAQLGSDFVRRRDVPETDLHRDALDLALQRARAVAVEHDDRQALDAALYHGLEGAAQLVGVGPGQHVPGGVGPRVDLHHRAVEQLGLADLDVEDVGPRLGPDLQKVAKATRYDQGARLPLALQQRVGRDGRPHTNLARRNRVVLGDAEQAANSDQRRPVGREHLGDPQLAEVGVVSDAVGKRPPAVDPELTLPCHSASRDDEASS